TKPDDSACRDAAKCCGQNCNNENRATSQQLRTRLRSRREPAPWQQKGPSYNARDVTMIGSAVFSPPGTAQSVHLSGSLVTTEPTSSRCRNKTRAKARQPALDLPSALR